MKICSVEGCGRKVLAGGLCGMHYGRSKVYGNPGEAAPRRASSGMGHTRKQDGYRMVHTPRGQVLEHLVVAEKMLGGPIPEGAEIHHINGDKSDNRPENLVVCRDRRHHALLHRQQNALDACGRADWRKCNICRQYDAPENLVIRPKGDSAYHRKCAADYQRNRNKRIAAAVSAALTKEQQK